MSVILKQGKHVLTIMEHPVNVVVLILRSSMVNMVRIHSCTSYQTNTYIR
jgi:hypothetical protein